VEVEAMSRTASPSANKPYGVARVAQVWNVPRSSFYAARLRAATAVVAAKRGPKTAFTDAELTDLIREKIRQTPFFGEGHRKIWARLRQAGIRTSKQRVLRLMRAAGLLAPARQPVAVNGHPHEGTIITEEPNQMWGTDATATVTVADGQVTVFAAIDHCTAECVGIHAVKRATRFEALEPIRQGVREHFGEFGNNVAAGLQLRHDHGSQYMSDDFQKELRFLGVKSSPAFLRQPEGNGCIERFFRSLKQQLLWIRHFDDLEQLRLALVQFRETYNRHWLLQRLQFRTPRQAREDFLAQRAAA
jgi:transposase InsO family protein